MTGAPQGAPVPVASPGGGRGGGRGNATAMLFTELCAGCHGAGVGGGRAPSLFDETWTRASDDEGLRTIIHDGIQGTEMMSFAGSLNDQQIWQLVAYIRTQAAALKDKPVFVADPDGQVVTSEKQTFKIEVFARDLETPWGLAFLPDGRLLITERPGRLRIVQKGKLLPDAVKGTPKVWEKQDGGLLDVEVHPQYAKNGWIYLSYAETLAWLRRAACLGSRRLPAANPGRRGEPAAPGRRAVRGRVYPPGSAVDDRHRARQDQQEQRVDRPAGHLPPRPNCTARPTRTTDRASSSTSKGICSSRSARRTTRRTRRTCRIRWARSTASTTTARCRRTIRS